MLVPPPSDADSTTLGAGLQRTGALIGRYKLRQQIGEGGFGVVFMAEQREPVVRKVALKIIKLGMDTRQVIARFEQERQALALMDHPNIAKVLDAGATETGRPYFVMELCTGDSITEYCDRTNLSIPERLQLFVQVCQAVQHAHHKGVIHRDIKPSNVLVHTQDGRPHAKIIDFGIAKATAAKLTERTLFTEHKQFIGTPQYMSPEQAEGSLDIDTRTDVYSLGVLLYELLTGVTPFDAKSLRSAAYAEIQRIIREVEPPKPSTRLSLAVESLASIAASRRSEPRKLSAMIRGELDWIVMKALEKDRQRRYETANGLAADIENYLTGEPVVAAPPAAMYRFRKLMQRHKGLVTAGTLVTLAILLGSGLAVAGFIQASRQRDLAVAAEARAVAEARRAAEAETQALLEARHATQVADFLTSMLKGAAPDVALGRDTTLLREIVDQTTARVEKELVDQPTVASRLLRIVSSVYNELAIYDKAEQTARRSIELARSVSGDARPTARALADLARVLEMSGRYDEAKRAYQESRDLYVAAGEGESDDALSALSGLGGLAYRTSDFKTAEVVFRTCIEGRRKLGDNGDQQRLANDLDRLSVVLRSLQRPPAESELLSREALAIRKRLFGEFHPDIALNLSNLARVVAAQKRFDDALALSSESIAQHHRLFGSRHPRTASVLEARATIFEEARRPAEAIPLMRESLAISTEALGAGHRNTLNANNHFANMLDSVQDYAGAEEQYRKMLAWGRANYPPGDNRTSAVIMLVARMVANQGRQSEAEALLREALEARIANRPAGHPQIVEPRDALADCLIAQGCHAEAEPLLIAVEQGAHTAPESSAARRAAQQRLIRFFVEWDAAEPGQGHAAAAEEWQAQLESQGGPAPGSPDHARTAITALTGRALTRQRIPAEQSGNRASFFRGQPAAARWLTRPRASGMATRSKARGPSPSAATHPLEGPRTGQCR